MKLWYEVCLEVGEVDVEEREFVYAAMVRGAQYTVALINKHQPIIATVCEVLQRKENDLQEG